MIVIKFDWQEFRRFQGALKKVKGLPIYISRAMMVWGQLLRRTTYEAAVQAGILPSTGRFYNQGIRYEQAPRGLVGRLLIQQNYVFLDSMRPHTVSVTRRRTLLLRWALNARAYSIQKKANEVAIGTRKNFGIFVKPHPFILQGYAIALPQLQPIIRSYLQMALSRGGINA